jgi:hypothetical protein
MSRVALVARVLLLSALTGCVVGGCIGLAATLLVHGGLESSFAYGPLSGALIGLAASGAFLGFSLNAGRRLLLSFISVALIIGAGTAAANLAAGLPPGSLFFAIVGLSEALGLLATALWLRSYRRWNKRLDAYRNLNRADRPPAGGS